MGPLGMGNENVSGKELCCEFLKQSVLLILKYFNISYRILLR